MSRLATVLDIICDDCGKSCFSFRTDDIEDVRRQASRCGWITISPDTDYCYSCASKPRVPDAKAQEEQ